MGEGGLLIHSDTHNPTSGCCDEDQDDDVCAESVPVNHATLLEHTHRARRAINCRNRQEITLSECSEAKEGRILHNNTYHTSNAKVAYQQQLTPLPTRERPLPQTSHLPAKDQGSNKGGIERNSSLRLRLRSILGRAPSSST